MKERILVIGNGMVGHHFVSTLAKSGHDVQITVIGEEARIAYDRVHLSEVFAGRTPDSLALSSATEYESWGVELVLDDPATSVDREAQLVKTASGRRFRYDRLVLATGSYPFVPPIEGHEHPRCLTYRTIDDLARIRSCAESAKVGVVIGGGLLGLECANALKNLGLKTHVIEFAPGLMGVQLDAGASSMLRQKIEDLDVIVHTSTATDRIEAGGEHALRLRFSDRSALDTDMVVFSAGIRPRDELARACGLSIGERGGIVIDESCRTSDDKIFAIGECALYDGRIFGLMAPGYRMAEAATACICDDSGGFKGADMSTKLKLLGVDVGGIGDAHGRVDDCFTFVYRSSKQGTYKRLVTSADGRELLGASLVGDCTEYDTLLQYYQNKIELPEDPQTLLGIDSASASVDLSTLPDTAVICQCQQVTKGTIVGAIQAGAGTLESVRAITGANTGCGSCGEIVQQFIELSGPATDENIAIELDSDEHQIVDTRMSA